MKLIDLSQPLYNGVPNCPAHPPVRVEIAADHPQDGWRLEILTIPSHTGSHVDVPYHRMATGVHLDQLPLEAFTGPAYIADLRTRVSDRTPIDSQLIACCLPWEDDSQHDIVQGKIVLLATGAGDLKESDPERWKYRMPYLTPEGAAYLVGRGVRAVGIDHYSIGGPGGRINDETHEILLGAGVWIVEDLHFPTEVFSLPQPVQFWSLPINLRGGSGMFCRPVIVVNS